jgi:PilX N-terminal
MLSKINKIHNDQAGVALVSAIFFVLFAVLLGFALSQSTLIAMKVATNERDNLEAFYVADAGINHAVNLLNKVPTEQFSTVLNSGTNTTPNTGDELSQPPITGLWTSAENIPAGDVYGGGVVNFGVAGSGRYWVKWGPCDRRSNLFCSADKRACDSRQWTSCRGRCSYYKRC